VTHYELLGVAPDATTADIRAAYRHRARALHPDRRRGTDRAMSAVNEAWHTLSDPQRRASYDASLVPPKALKAPKPRAASASAATGFGSRADDDPGQAWSDIADPQLSPVLTRRLHRMIVITACAAAVLLVVLYIYAFAVSGPP
jgi:curved DNA-binding protein CbpA